MTLAAVYGALDPEAARRLRHAAATGALTPELAAEVHRLVLDSDRRPLAYARLWDSPRTSQRRAVQRLAEPGTLALALFGGTGSGKTEAGAQLAVASAYGRQHPDALEWCRANGIDTAILPPKPGRVLASSKTHDESRRVVREKLKKYLPSGSVWRNEMGPGPSEVRLPGGGIIVCKSNEETYTGFEADEADCGWLDEEHDHAVFNAAKSRLGRRGWAAGWLINTMTPLRGKTWVYGAFEEATPGDGHLAVHIHGDDNPYLDAKFQAALYAKGYDAAELAARKRGDFADRSGLVWPASRDVHAWDGDPDPSWPRYEAADWGTTVPTAVGLAAYDEANDVIYVLDEVYAAGTTIGQRAALIRDLEARWCPDEAVYEVGRYGSPADRLTGETIPGTPAARWGDPEDASTMQTLAREHGIAFARARKDISEGLNVVRSRLTPDVNGVVHLRIHRRCVAHWREIENYVWDPKKADTPRKIDDHAMDALRYLCVGVDRRYRLIGALTTGDTEADVVG